MSWIGSEKKVEAQQSTLQPGEQLNKDQLKTKIDGFVSQSPQSLYLIDGYVFENCSLKWLGELTYNSIVKKVQREVLFADKMKMVAKRE